MNVIDRDLEAVKRIADALTPLGIDVVAVRSVTSVDWKDRMRILASPAKNLEAYNRGAYDSCPVRGGSRISRK